MQDHHDIEGLSLQFRESRALKHVQEILGEGVVVLRVAEVERPAEILVPQHIVCISDDRRELGDQLDALAHQVLRRQVIRILVECIHLQHAASENVHDIVAAHLDDVQNRPLLQEHVVHQSAAERLQLVRLRETAGQEKETRLLVAESALRDGRMDNIPDVILPEEEPAFGGDDPLRTLVIADDIADTGKPHKDSCAVFVSQTALYVVLLEEIDIDPGTLYQVLRKTSDKFVSANHCCIIFLQKPHGDSATAITLRKQR